MNTATIFNYLRNPKLNKKRLAIAAIAIIFVLYLCIWLLGKIFNFLFTQPESPFVGLVPSSAPLAFEGTPKQVSDFLRDRCGLIADFKNNELSEKYQDARILVAILPQDSKEATVTTPECQAYVLDLASNIEELWNQKSAYPSSVSPFPPCPSGGQATYSSNGAQFTITCSGKQHKTVYDSQTGLASANTTTTANKAASNLPERNTRDLAAITKDRLASLQDAPNVMHALQNTDISARMQAQNPSQVDSTGTSYYEDTLTASGKLAQELDSQNIPLSLQELPNTFKIEAPFIIAIANVKEQLPECSTLPSFKNIQIWMSAPEAVSSILQERTPQSEALVFAPAQETSFQLICHNSTFNQLFSELPLNLPSESRLYLSKTNSSAGQEAWSGRLLLPEQYKTKFNKMIATSENAEDLLSKLKPSTASLSANVEILDLLSISNLGWRSLPDPNGSEIQPTMVAASFNSMGHSNFKQICLQLAKAFKGRVGFNTTLHFADNGQAEAWLSASPWSSKNATYSQIEVKGKSITINDGKFPEVSAPSLPKGPSPSQACGWITLHNAQGRETVTSFSLGVDTQHEESAETLWIRIEQQSK